MCRLILIVIISFDKVLPRIIAGFKAKGQPIDTVTIDDLSAVDEFHIGGVPAALSLFDQLDLESGDLVVDIGCGLAVYHLKIDAFYRGRVEHYLVDRSANEVGQKRDFGYSKTKELAFYNSLECAASILAANGVAAERLRPVNASETALRVLRDGSADVVMSLLSWGYHYPISTYAAEAFRVLRPAVGRLIFTHSRWGDIKAQLNTLQSTGFICKVLGSFVCCCVRCDKSQIGAEFLAGQLAGGQTM